MISPAATISLPVRPANEQAEQITGRRYISYSQISCMRSCPKKFEFQYVLDTPPDHLSSSLVFGGSIHAALELHYRSRMEGLTVTAPALLSHYHDAWKQTTAKTDAPIRFCKDENQDKLDALANRMISSFLESPVSQPKGRILGVEEQLTITLDDDLPDVLARVDLVIQGEDALHVIDFKTSKSRWNQTKAEESGEQLLLYTATLDGLSQELSIPSQGHFVVLTKAKTPVVQLMDVPVSPQRVDSTRLIAKQVWEAIVIGNFYPNPTPQNCTYCQYRSKCPVFAGR